MAPPITRSSSRNLPSGYQSSIDQPLQEFRPSECTNTLDEIKNMLNGIKVQTEFEKSMKTVVSLLIGQIKDWRLDTIKKEQENLFRHEKLSDTMDDMTLSVVKSEQYTRRDVVTVVGLPLADGPESQTDLSTKVAQALSQSGEDVKPADFSA